METPVASDEIKLPDDLEFDGPLPDDLQFEDSPAPAQARSEPQEGAFKAALRSILHGASAGWADEVARARAVNQSLRRGDDPGAMQLAADTAGEEWNQQLSEAQRRHPVPSFAGDVIGSMTFPGGTSRTGQVAADMAYSGLRGAGEADGGNRLSAAMDGAETGGLTSIGGQAMGEIMNFLSRPVRRAFAGRERDVAETIARGAEDTARSELQRARQVLATEQAEAGRHASRLLDPDYQRSAGTIVPPRAASEAQDVLRHQFERAGEFLADRVRPTLQPTRSAAQIAEEAVSAGSVPRAVGREALGAVRRDLRQIPGVNTVMTMASATGRILSAPATRLSFYRQAQEILRVNPQRFGRYANVLREAADKGETSFAATDFVLSQNNPDYREMKRQLDEEDGDA